MFIFLHYYADYFSIVVEVIQTVVRWSCFAVVRSHITFITVAVAFAFAAIAGAFAASAVAFCSCTCCCSCGCIYICCHFVVFAIAWPPFRF